MLHRTRRLFSYLLVFSLVISNIRFASPADAALIHALVFNQDALAPLALSSTRLNRSHSASFTWQRFYRRQIRIRRLRQSVPDVALKPGLLPAQWKFLYPLIGSAPSRHRVQDLRPFFKAGNPPSGRTEVERKMLDPRTNFGLLSSEWISMVLLVSNSIGTASGITSKPLVEKIKEQGDLIAQDVQNLVAKAFGLRLQHVLFETKGEISGGVQAGEIGGDPAGTPTYVITDPIENTSAYAKGLPGASAMHLDGEGANTFGSFPDVARALMVATHLDRRMIPIVLTRHHAVSLKSFLDPRLSAATLVQRIAELNEVAADQCEVVVLPNGSASGGKKEIVELTELARSHPGLVIHEISGGTVRPAIPAMLGPKNRKIQIFLGRSGMTEGVWKVYFAHAVAGGSYAAFRVVSETIKKNFADGFDWDKDVALAQKIDGMRKDDWRRAIYSSEDPVRGSLSGDYAFITIGEADAQWPIEVPGVRMNARKELEVSTLEFASGGMVALSHDVYQTSPPGSRWIAKISATFLPWIPIRIKKSDHPSVTTSFLKAA